MMSLFNRSTITPLLQKDNPLNSITSSLSQQGRSMIEMLAVLAIIGVLSVIAVAGLMWAFAKYKANNTIHDVHLWELAALDSQQLYEMTSGELVLNELSFYTWVSYGHYGSR